MQFPPYVDRWLAPVLVAGLVLFTPASGSAQNVQSQNWLDKLLRCCGLGLAAGDVRGPEAGGDLWQVDLDSGERVALTSSGDFRSPVYEGSGHAVLALRGEDVVRIRPGRPPERLTRLAGVAKLVGFQEQSSKDLVVLLERPQSPLAVWNLDDGRLHPLPLDGNATEVMGLISRIRGQERGTGEKRLWLNKERRQGVFLSSEWTDVYLSEGSSAPRNLSRCDGADCSQPTISIDGRRVVYVRKTAE